MNEDSSQHVRLSGLIIFSVFMTMTHSCYFEHIIKTYQTWKIHRLIRVSNWSLCTFVRRTVHQPSLCAQFQNLTIFVVRILLVAVLKSTTKMFQLNFIILLTQCLNFSKKNIHIINVSYTIHETLAWPWIGLDLFMPRWSFSAWVFCMGKSQNLFYFGNYCSIWSQIM